MVCWECKCYVVGEWVIWQKCGSPLRDLNATELDKICFSIPLETQNKNIAKSLGGTLESMVPQIVVMLTFSCQQEEPVVSTQPSGKCQAPNALTLSSSLVGGG